MKSVPTEQRTLIPIATGRRRPYILEITRHELPMAGLPKSLHGAKVAHITDIHAGYGGTDPVLDEVVSRVNAEDVDFVFFTGDYVDDSIEDYPIEAYIRRFRARRGLFGSLGNHDYNRGIVDRRRSQLEAAGVHVLCDDNVKLESGLWICGADDLTTTAPDVTAATAGLPAGETGFLLSHHPGIIDRVGDRNLVILSGHTHAGQIVLPFPNPRIVCWFHLRCRHIGGWYRQGDARLYVSRGVGVTGAPFRYRCPAEVALFRLVPAEASPAASVADAAGDHQMAVAAEVQGR